MRPVVIVTRPLGIAVRTHVTVAPITRTIRDIPTEVPVGPNEGLRHPSVASCDDLTTIPKQVLGDRVGALSPALRHELDAAICFALGISLAGKS
jgi:mRNA interferase MazF